MRLRMSDNSLFAILLRSRWWISMAIAIGIGAGSRALLPDAVWGYGAAGAFPFLVISALAARRHWGMPTAAQVEAIAQTCRALSRTEFVARLEHALIRDGHAVQRIHGAGADLLAQRAGRRTLYACARWKAASSGAEALEALVTEIDRQDAHDGVFVALGEIGEGARAVAVRQGIRILGPIELAGLLKRIDGTMAVRG